jgi:hypothetical protein
LLNDVGGGLSPAGRAREQARLDAQKLLVSSTQLTEELIEELFPQSEQEIGLWLLSALFPLAELSVIGGQLTFKIGKKVIKLGAKASKAFQHRYGGRTLQQAIQIAQRSFELSRKFIPGAGTIVRNDAKLIANLGGFVPEGFTAHHLIPISSAKKWKILQRAADLGYDINRANNGMWLPNTVAGSLDSQLPLHLKRGTHIPSYFEKVDELVGSFQRAYPEFLDENFQPTPEKLELLQTTIAEIEDILRNQLSQRMLFLQRKDPHLRKLIEGVY